MDGMALDPYLAPFQVDPAQQQPSVQMAQAAPAPTPAPAAPPLPGYYDLRTGQGDQTPDAQPPAAPPTAVQTRAPPPPPQNLPAYVIDFNDEEDYKQSQTYEMSLYEKKLLNHKSGNAEPLDVTREQHAEWPQFLSIMEDWNKLHKSEQTSGRRFAIQQKLDRIDADTRRAQTDLRAARRAEAHQMNAQRMTPEASEKTAQLMTGYVDNELAAATAASKHSDPEKKKQGDFNLKTSPLTTMQYKDAAGNVTLQPLRDAVTQMKLHNEGISNDQIARYTIAIGSPVGFDPKTKQALPGMNDVGGKVIRGKGATQYVFLGRAPDDTMLIRMDDGQVLRVPPQTFKNLGRAREAGWAAAKKWMDDDKTAREHKDWGTRQLEKIIPPKGF